MEESPKIKDLPEVIQPYLDGGEIISYTSRYLTKPGDNYGSLMISIAAKVKTSKGDIEDLPLVAKLTPFTNEYFMIAFQPERTFRTEATAYRDLSSEIRKLQLEMGVKKADLFDSFAKYYGSRVSLDPNSKTVDRDAVIVLENLQTSGYKAGDRHRMFNLAETKLIITEVAKFHALSIALRLKKPEVFEKKIRPYFDFFQVFNNMSEKGKNSIINTVLKEVEKSTNNDETILHRVKEIMKKSIERVKKPNIADGPFTSIGHCDLWINNILLKYDESGEPRKVMFVDFQTSYMDHVSSDIIFLLFSSVDPNVVDQHFYEFFELYYKEFIKCLQSVGISTDNYNYDDFLTEVRTIGSISIWPSMAMTPLILADKDGVPDFKEVNVETFEKCSNNPAITQKIGEIIRLADKFQLF